MTLTEEITYTYDELVDPANRPAFMAIEKHADFDNEGLDGHGVIMLWAPTVMTGTVLRPGQQLNATYDPAQVAIVAYSVGAVDGAGEAAADDTGPDGSEEGGDEGQTPGDDATIAGRTMEEHQALAEDTEPDGSEEGDGFSDEDLRDAEAALGLDPGTLEVVDDEVLDAVTDPDGPSGETTESTTPAPEAPSEPATPEPQAASDEDEPTPQETSKAAAAKPRRRKS